MLSLFIKKTTNISKCLCLKKLDEKTVKRLDRESDNGDGRGESAYEDCFIRLSRLTDGKYYGYPLAMIIHYSINNIAGDRLGHAYCG